MMAINGITGTNASMQTGSGMNMQTDTVSRNIQNQIAAAQKKLQELSSDDSISLEEKMKKRQEIQQEINNLNQQLRQHQIEQRKKQQSENTSTDGMPEKQQKTGDTKPGSKGQGRRGLSQAVMQAVVSADSSIEQAQVQGSVATNMKGMASVLKSEIKQDAGRGKSVEAKEAGLAAVEQKAMDATSMQNSILADAKKVVHEAVKADQDNSTDKASAKSAAENGDQDKNTDKTSEETTAAETYVTGEEEQGVRPVSYVPINILL